MEERVLSSHGTTSGGVFRTLTKSENLTFQQEKMPRPVRMAIMAGRAAICWSSAEGSLRAVRVILAPGQPGVGNSLSPRPSRASVKKEDWPLGQPSLSPRRVSVVDCGH